MLCHVTKIVDGKNISGSIDTYWYKANFTWITSSFWLIFHRQFYLMFKNKALKTIWLRFLRQIQMFQWYFSDINRHPRSRNISLCWPVLRLVLATTPLLSADGTSLLTDNEAILKRWAEHFDSVLNRPSSISDDAINRLPRVECNLQLDEFPTVAETVKVIKLLSPGKAPGSDAVPAEIYKAGGTPVTKKMTELFHIMWRKEAIPQEFKDESIIYLFKRKGINLQLCDNHRCISLLSIAGKILARILLNQLNEQLEQSGLLPESHCGFRKDRGTIDMIFTARQL